MIFSKLDKFFIQKKSSLFKNLYYKIDNLLFDNAKTSYLFNKFFLFHFKKRKYSTKKTLNYFKRFKFKKYKKKNKYFFRKFENSLSYFSIFKNIYFLNKINYLKLKKLNKYKFFNNYLKKSLLLQNFKNVTNTNYSIRKPIKKTNMIKKKKSLIKIKNSFFETYKNFNFYSQKREIRKRFRPKYRKNEKGEFEFQKIKNKSFNKITISNISKNLNVYNDTHFLNFSKIKNINNEEKIKNLISRSNYNFLINTNSLEIKKYLKQINFNDFYNISNIPKIIFNNVLDKISNYKNKNNQIKTNIKSSILKSSTHKLINKSHKKIISQIKNKEYFSKALRKNQVSFQRNNKSKLMPKIQHLWNRKFHKSIHNISNIHFLRKSQTYGYKPFFKTKNKKMSGKKDKYIFNKKGIKNISGLFNNIYLKKKQKFQVAMKLRKLLKLYFFDSYKSLHSSSINKTKMYLNTFYKYFLFLNKKYFLKFTKKSSIQRSNYKINRLQSIRNFKFSNKYTHKMKKLHNVKKFKIPKFGLNLLNSIIIKNNFKKKSKFKKLNSYTSKYKFRNSVYRKSINNIISKSFIKINFFDILNQVMKMPILFLKNNFSCFLKINLICIFHCYLIIILFKIQF